MIFPIGPDADSDLDDLLFATIRAAVCIGQSPRGWPGAQTRMLLFTRRSRRAVARTNDGEKLFAQWFVYVKGSKGIWLGENAQLYYKLGMSKEGQEAFVYLPIQDAIEFSTGDKAQLIRQLDDIRP